MIAQPFFLVTPSTRGLSLAITRHLLQTTQSPVVATHRSNKPDAIRERILSPLQNVDQDRLHLLQLELKSEDSIAAAAQSLADVLAKSPKGDAYIHTAFFTGGVLHPERQPEDLIASNIEETFDINVISHLILIKHFSRFLPLPQSHHTSSDSPLLSKWVHISARVGSISDNRLGGWFSYRASKAALNQTIRTFDLYLQQRKILALCVGMHPGTVKTDLSKEFWHGVPDGKLFEPEDAAAKVVNVVQNLDIRNRGKVLDWAGNEVPP
ncbi:uncharacterized protein FIBRA_05543 [Fibroporia radiculosa]|uniref:NAD(P)-binding protein n=1 Tax=Fibroporia radiculosa TaxID=599839 RepID=J4HXQ5_9APHY|nr:uncharacterized protein FIBRA_05543 [Fibroporia radiculosa]CCM03412.1 predicted protein [Fibroporia radiculosa]